MTTPAIRAIRKGFPGSLISILAKPWVAPVFKSSPYIDNVLIYNGDNIHKGIRGKLHLARDLRQYRFDAAILLQNAFEAALITFLARIPCRIGYDTDARRMLLTHAVPCTSEIKREHQTGYYLNIIRSLGLEDDGEELYLQLSRESRVRAENILRRHGISPEERMIGINPSATFGPAKQWFPERYALLSDKIYESNQMPIILFGGPEDKELGRKISTMMQHRPIDLTGRTSLGEAMALIERCALFITNDSGLMHVAAALKTPLIAIFGSTNPTTTGPFSSNSRVVQIPMDCSPCLKPECPQGHLDCMEQIGVDAMFDVVKDML